MLKSIKKQTFSQELIGDTVVALALTVAFTLLGYLSHNFAVQMKANIFGGWGLF